MVTFSSWWSLAAILAIPFIAGTGFGIFSCMAVCLKPDRRRK